MSHPLDFVIVPKDTTPETVDEVLAPLLDPHVGDPRDIEADSWWDYWQPVTVSGMMVDTDVVDMATVDEFIDRYENRLFIHVPRHLVLPDGTLPTSEERGCFQEWIDSVHQSHITSPDFMDSMKAMEKFREKLLGMLEPYRGYKIVAVTGHH